MLNCRRYLSSKNFLKMAMNRSEILCDFPSNENTLYLMRRDQRIKENHCIELAYELSKKKLFVVYDYNFVPKNRKQTDFILQGIPELIEQANELNLFIKILYQKNELEEFVNKNKISLIITDFSPLRDYFKYDTDLTLLCKKNEIKLIRCDAHNIVPCHKLTIYKRTGCSVRMYLYKFWDTFFKDYVTLTEYKFNDRKDVKKYNEKTKEEFEKEEKEIRRYFSLSNKKLKVESGKCSELASNSYYSGGYTNGMKEFEKFLKDRFRFYESNRNKPEENALSNLSPWLHTGQISPLKIIYTAVERFGKSNKNVQTFISEAFVWRETAEHFCYHEKDYDNLKGALPWARKTLEVHAKDKRSVVYTLEQLEAAKTNDTLWNAGQKQMLVTGKMHGYVRMYWAKTLMQWSPTPKEALERAVYLNDKYSLDGNDPNGYLGIMWCICGSMDRGFGERQIIGKIRSMKRFQCPSYIDKWVAKKAEDYIYK